MVPVLKALIQRNKLDPKMVDEFCLGSAGTVTACITHDIWLTAGLPQSVAGFDSARQCASSSNIIGIAANMIMNDDADIIIAGGLETMDRKGPVQAWQIGQRGSVRRTGPQVGQTVWGYTEDQKYPDDWKFAKTLLPRIAPPLPEWTYDMGMTAEELCKRFGVTRQECDEYSLTSHQRTFAAQDKGYFNDEIVPIKLEYKDGTSEVVTTDQCPRRETSLDKLASLPGAYKADGLITAGNSSPRSDGATLVLMMSKQKAKELGYKPLMTFRHAVAAGVDPTIMGVGPVYATKKILARTGMKISDFDIFEVNEAFACVVRYFVREMGIPEKDVATKVNPNGGGIAIGHPLGATGARQAAVIARHLQRTGGRWGMATLCAGGGQGMTTIFEREDYK
jgi:acetyl-CoA acyltransferase